MTTFCLARDRKAVLLSVPSDPDEKQRTLLSFKVTFCPLGPKGPVQVTYHEAGSDFQIPVILDRLEAKGIWNSLKKQGFQRV